MPKISDLLPPPEPINGEEKIPVVQNDDTWGLPLGEFLEETVAAATAKSEEWAHGTLPGGVGTKSAKEHAQDAAATAAALDDKLITTSERSGYVGGWQTPAGLLGLGFRNDDLRPIFGNGGDVVTRIETVEESAPEIVAQPRSGVLAGFRTPAGRLPFFLDRYTGKPYFLGRSILDEIDALEGGGVAGEIPAYPEDALLVGGDSLSTLATGGDWPAKLGALLGVPVENLAIGGQGSRQIAARLNAVPAQLVAAITIPASTTPVALTVIDNWTPCSNSGLGAITVTIGGVAGVLTRDGSGNHTFTRSGAGDEVEVPAGSKILTVAAENAKSRTLIIGSGRNSFLSSSGDPLNAQTIVASIKAAIDRQNARVKRAIVWGIPPGDTETTGSTNRTTLNTVNAAIQAAFPAEWLDIPAWLRTTVPTTINGITVNDPFTVTGITPTSQDTTDIANGVTPVSLRASGDGLHFNDAGGTAIAYRMDMEFRIRGWKA